MNSLGFWGKHYRSMYTGSMMGMGTDVFSVMGYVIAHGEKGQVELNPKLLSVLLGMSEEAAEKAIACLCAPDPRSRNKEHDGARLIKTGTFTYTITGWEKYHPAANNQDRREYFRERKREERQRKKNQTEAVSEIPPLDNGKLEAFSKFWEAYPKKKDRHDAEHAFVEVLAADHLPEILKALTWQKSSSDWTREDGRFIPSPAKYLRNGSWHDRPATQTPSRSFIYDPNDPNRPKQLSKEELDRREREKLARAIRGEEC